MATKFDPAQLNTIFQSILGRSPTQQESDFLKPYIENDTLSYDQAGKYLQSTPEYLQTRQHGQLSQYQNLLQQNNASILSQAADAANSQFAQNGRQFSTGQGNAVLQAGQQLAAQQSPMIANYYQGQSEGLNQAYGEQGQNALFNAYNLTNQQRQYQNAVELARMGQNYNTSQNSTGLAFQRGLAGILPGIFSAGAQGVGAGLASKAGALFGG